MALRLVLPSASGSVEWRIEPISRPAMATSKYRRKNKSTPQTHRNTCPKRKGPKFGGKPRQRQAAILDDIVDDIEAGGRKIKDIVDEAKVVSPWISRDMVNYHRKKQRAQKEGELAQQDSASGSEDEFLGFDETPPRAAGRPKGTTAESKKAKVETMEKAVYWVTMALKSKQDGLSQNRMRLPKGTFEEVVAEARTKFGLPESFQISKDTVKSRIRSGIVDVPKPRCGLTTPLGEVENVLSTIIIESNRARMPLDAPAIIRLANDLIRGTPHEERVIDFLIENNPKRRQQYKERGCVRPDLAYLDIGWYNGFKKRHPELSAQKAVNFDDRRATWCTYDNMAEMYENVYQRWADLGHAKRLDEPEWQDMEGNKVLEEDAFGHKVEFRLTQPERIIFFDEMGDNTNTTKDKNAGKQRFLIGRGERAQVPANNGNTHFTVLGLTAATGEPVMFVVIIQKESALLVGEQYGLDLDAPWIGRKNDVALNCGPGKRYPGGPTCRFNGKTIPCFVTNSSSGGMDGTILKNILKRLDDLEVYERNDDLPDPALLVDGHSSRLDIEFRRYTTNYEHRWDTCFGLPNGTSYWQLGDAMTQNGQAKRHMVLKKRSIMQEKLTLGENTTIDRRDVMLVVNSAFSKSFGNVAGNKKAIAQRGWNPLNRGCLVDPKILDTKVAQQQHSPEQHSPEQHSESSSTAQSQDTTSTIESLNFEAGAPAEVVDRIIQKRNRVAGQHKEREQARRDRRSNARLWDGVLSGRMTTGGFFRAGLCYVPDDLQEFLEEQAVETETKKRKQVVKKHREAIKVYKAGLDLRLRKKPEKDWNSNDLATAIKFKVLGRDKKKFYSKFPAKVDERKALWERVKNLPDPGEPYLEEPEKYRSLVQRGSSDEECSLVDNSSEGQPLQRGCSAGEGSLQELCTADGFVSERGSSDEEFSVFTNIDEELTLEDRTRGSSDGEFSFDDVDDLVWGTRPTIEACPTSSLQHILDDSDDDDERVLLSTSVFRRRHPDCDVGDITNVEQL